MSIEIKSCNCTLDYESCCGARNTTDTILPNYISGAYRHEVIADERLSPDLKFKKIVDSIGELMEYKNIKYGNAALEPLGIFEGKTKVGQRLDDKLARVKNGNELSKNDVADLIGYLVLTCKEKGWDNFDEFKD